MNDDFAVENRGRGLPIPPNLKNIITEHQLLAIRAIENFGWDLKFVRSQGVKAPVVVVCHPDGHTLGVLESDGRLNLEHGIRFRP